MCDEKIKVTKLKVSWGNYTPVSFHKPICVIYFRSRKDFLQGRHTSRQIYSITFSIILLVCLFFNIIFFAP